MIDISELNKEERTKEIIKTINTRNTLYRFQPLSNYEIEIIKKISNFTYFITNDILFLYKNKNYIINTYYTSSINFKKNDEFIILHSIQQDYIRCVLVEGRGDFLQKIRNKKIDKIINENYK